MKKFYCFIMAISLLIGCESKIDCPVCKGEGKVLVYGEECRCAGCNGKGSLTNDEYKELVDKVNRMKQMRQSTSGTNRMISPYTRRQLEQSASDEGKVKQSQEPMEDCPFCNGRGSNGNGTCGFCNGEGQVSQSAAAQGRHVIGGGSLNDIYPSSSSGGSNTHSSSGNGCSSCNRTGDCQHCNGLGVVEYDGQYNTEGGYMKCPICKGNKRCNVFNRIGNR